MIVRQSLNPYIEIFSMAWYRFWCYDSWIDLGWPGLQFLL